MFSHYQAVKQRERYKECFGVAPPSDPGNFDVWLGYTASFIPAPRKSNLVGLKRHPQSVATRALKEILALDTGVVR